jgi:hypothetical protein
MKYTKPRRHLFRFRNYYFALATCCLITAALAGSLATTQAAIETQPSVYSGLLERADCSQISGYAYDVNDENATVFVDITDGANFSTTVPADRFRRDLERAGWLNPFHGFLISTPASLKDGKIHPIAALFSGTGIHLSDSPKFIACNSSLFPTAQPVTTASGQGQTWEQGVEISSSMKGTIAKVRFWRSAGEPQGNHIARIWSMSGNQLAWAPFNETSSPGWQYATLNFPITVGTHYKITYNIHNEVAKTFHVFQNGPITKGPLERLAEISRPHTAPATFLLMSCSTRLNSEIEACPALADA